MSCPEYTTVSADKRSCEMPNCNEREIFTKDGRCQECPENSFPELDGYSCSLGAETCEPVNDVVYERDFYGNCVPECPEHEFK